MKKKRKFLKILLITLGALAVIFAGFFVYLMIGQDTVSKMAIEDADIQSLPDGVYDGAYDGYRWSNSVKVTVRDRKITDIEVVKGPAFMNQKTVDELISRVIQEQRLPVDVVSGATVSSKAFLKAVENALKNLPAA